MKTYLIRALVLSACVLFLACAANAQKSGDKSGAAAAQSGNSLAKDTGNAAVVIVSSAAKVGWWTTKFAAKNVAKPLVVKAAPSVGKYALKKSAKYLLPLAIKLSIL